MAADNVCQRPNGHKLGDLPIIWNQLPHWSYPRQDDHHGNHGNTPDEGDLELLDDGGNFLEERGIGRFFRSGAPAHVDAKKVAKDGLRNMNGDTAKECSEDKKPFEVLEY